MPENVYKKCCIDYVCVHKTVNIRKGVRIIAFILMQIDC